METNQKIITQQGSSLYEIPKEKLNKIIERHRKHKLFMPYHELLNTTLFNLNYLTVFELVILNLIYFKIATNSYGYSLNFIAFDFACILSVLFLKMFNYKILTGKIKGYYREDYYYFHLIIKYFSIVYYGAFIRLILHLILTGNIVNIIKSFVCYKLYLIVFIINLLMIYILFYSEKAVSVRGFNNAVVYLKNTDNDYSITLTQDIVVDKMKRNYKESKINKSKKLIEFLKKHKLIKTRNKNNNDFSYDGDDEGKKIFEELKPHELDRNDPRYISKDPNDLKYYHPSIRHIVKQSKENEERDDWNDMKARAKKNKGQRTEKITKNEDNVIQFPQKNRPS